GVGALLDQLGGAVLGEEVHHHEGPAGADREVHGPADGRDGTRGAGRPVGEVAADGDLVGAEDAVVEVAAAHHGEAVGVVEVGGAGEFGDGLLAGVDEVGVDRVVGGERAHAEHAVLGVEGDVLFGAQVVGDEGGRADAEVDERTGRDV